MARKEDELFVYRIHPPLADGEVEDEAEGVKLPRLSEDALRSVDRMVAGNPSVAATLDHIANTETIRHAEIIAHATQNNSPDFFHNVDWKGLTHHRVPSLGEVVRVIRPESQADFWRRWFVW